MIYLELFLIFFKIGLFTFGGGYAMLPMIQDEIIAKNWIDTASLIDFTAVSESTPGSFAVNIATYVGAETGGFFGSVCATLGVVAPSFIIILIVAKFYEKFRKSICVKGLMTGLKPVVAGLIGAAAITVAETVFFPAGISLSVFSLPAFYVSAVIFIFSLILNFKKIHPIIIIGISAAAGIIGGYLVFG